MKRSACFISLILSLVVVSLTASATASDQKDCEFKIVGTWKAATTDGANAVIYRFNSDATVTVLSPSGSDQELKEVASVNYVLDDAKMPKVILFTAAREGGGFSQGVSPMEITAYDDRSFTVVKTGSKPTRWVKVEPYQYYLTLAGRSEVYFDHSGPAFPMLIKMDGRQSEIDAVGVYFAKENRRFGSIPAELYSEFLREPRTKTDVMLRLEITAAQYERALKIMRTWDRRAREGALLYPDVSLDNILLVKQVTESLNLCGERVKLYNLDWGIQDDVSENNRPSNVPFKYFKELKRLNESLHVRDDRFQVSLPAGPPLGH